MTQRIRVLMIDNYDSFTYNLVDQFRQLDCEVIVYRNDTPVELIEKTIDENAQERKQQDVIVISPGPGNPDEAGNTLSIIQTFAGRLPILGICLGHQSIVQHFGGKIGKAHSTVHGKAKNIELKQHPIFDNLPQQFRAARYHSLAAKSIPKQLKVIAFTQDENQQEVMAVIHKEHKVIGFQFHPESILTTFGKALIKNTVEWLSKENEKSVIKRAKSVSAA